jgi:hypothetical protein
MPASPRVQYTTFEVDEDFLPHPAVSLVVTQYFAASDDSSAWAWIIVGAFYNRHDEPVWSAEIVISQSDVDSGSVIGESTDESDTNSPYDAEDEEESGSCE